MMEESSAPQVEVSDLLAELVGVHGKDLLLICIIYIILSDVKPKKDAMPEKIKARVWSLL
jgi:hypothetical protein